MSDGRPVYALDFPLWKRSCVQLLMPDRALHFVGRDTALPPNITLIVWGRRDEGLPLPEGVQVLRLEDGFVRSVGLGADWIRPLSWVVDDLGIYYDATCPSRLEAILQHTQFSPALRGRAAALRDKIVAARLSKYNLQGGKAWQRPELRRVILVPGQVESDASIKYGAPEGVCAVRTNLALLQAVREANPDAWIVYKPHPDVVAGLRKAGSDAGVALKFCDELIVDAPIDSLIEQVDEVHVLTSLTGFEALLRGKRVVCYGQPFYAGWGLTVDQAPIARRTRVLALDELVAGALIEYPTYFSKAGDRLLSVEEALQALLEWRDKEKPLPWWRRPLRWVLRCFKY